MIHLWNGNVVRYSVRKLAYDIPKRNGNTLSRYKLLL